MVIKFLVIHGIILLTCALLNEVNSQDFGRRDTIERKEIFAGGIYTHVSLPALPLHYFVFEFDAAKAGELTSVLSNNKIPDFKRNNISAVCEREAHRNKSVVAAINADFFRYRTGELEGLQLTNGEVIYATDHRTKYGMSINPANRIKLDSTFFMGSLTVANKSFRIKGVNTYLYKDSVDAIVVFNHFFSIWPDSLKKHSYVVIKKLHRPGKFKIRNFTTEVPQNISPNEYVLMLNANDESPALMALKRESRCRLNLDLQLTSDPNFVVKEHISGGVPLVMNGINMVDTIRGYGGNRGKIHPRTAIGINSVSQKMVWLVIDGRSKASRGASYDDMARLFIEMGCTEAVNLDGGGSSALWINGKIMNVPSDKEGPRPCLNYLLLHGKQ